MNTLNKFISEKKERPVKILQFGEGNFLRGFADYAIDLANERGILNGDITILKPIPYGNLLDFKTQDNQYTVILNGLLDNKPQTNTRLITSIKESLDIYKNYKAYMDYHLSESLRFIISNTTESGIVFNPEDEYTMTPPSSYPAKLTQFLYKRFLHFNGSNESGLIILPVELIEDNGKTLKNIILKYSDLWNLDSEFNNWINDACIFCSTLVDRIVTGYPKDDEDILWNSFNYIDKLMVSGEHYFLWVIESKKDISLELPLNNVLPVIFTNDLSPYRNRKVRILNGAHTSFSLLSFLAGNETVLESMEDELIYNFIKSTIFDEIIMTVTLPKDELMDYANNVLNRFKNPFIKHSLLSISLNSISKWKCRCLKSYITYFDLNNEIPKNLAFSLSSLIAFYKFGNGNDDEALIEFIKNNSIEDILKSELLWGYDITKIGDSLRYIENSYNDILELGMRKALIKHEENNKDKSRR